MDKLTVIKIGGQVIDDESRLIHFLRSFARLEGEKILVHGGGKLATRLAGQLGIEQKMVDGRRITDEETLKIVTMVYAGYVNKRIVALLQSMGCAATGLSGADGDVVRAHKRVHPTIDFGFVGDVDHINTRYLGALLQNHQSVVMAPITHDGHGLLLNTNADTIAQEIARGMSREYEVSLIYCFEKNGVLLDAEDDTTVIPHISRGAYLDLKAANRIFAGMIPKLDNAFSALDSGVKKVIIGKAENLADLVKGASGTSITHE